MDLVTTSSSVEEVNLFVCCNSRREEATSHGGMTVPAAVHTHTTEEGDGISCGEATSRCEDLDSAAEKSTF